MIKGSQSGDGARKCENLSACLFYGQVIQLGQTAKRPLVLSAIISEIIRRIGVDPGISSPIVVQGRVHVTDSFEKKAKA
jgi:hypothetical protein